MKYAAFTASVLALSYVLLSWCLVFAAVEVIVLGKKALHQLKEGDIIE